MGRRPILGRSATVGQVMRRDHAGLVKHLHLPDDRISFVPFALYPHPNPRK